MPEHPAPAIHTRIPRRGVGCARGDAPSGHGADAQDLAVPLPDNHRQPGEAEHHDGAEVDGEHRVPVGGLRPGHRAERRRACGRHEHVQASELGDRLFDECLHRGVLRDVGRYRERPAAARTDLRRDLGELLPRPRCEHDTRAFRGEREGDRPADPPPRARDERDLPLERAPRVRQIWSPRPDLISSMNSARVSGRSRKAPSIADVTALEFCFSTPRMSMQRWIASMTTATPRGWSASFSVFAIWVVSRSCTCSRRLYISTSRGIFERPTIFLRGMYAMWALPKNGII